MTKKRFFQRKTEHNEEWIRNHEYRSYWDLYASILAICIDGPRSPSYIARYANMKFSSVKKHVEVLVGKRWLLIITDSNLLENKKYETTQEGIQYVEKYLDLWNYAFKDKQ